MKVVILALLGFIVCSLSADAPLRLIQFNESYSEWLTEAQVHELSIANVKFMDITDFPQVKKVNLSKVMAYPSGPSFQSVVNPLLELLSVETLWESLEIFSSFPTRYYTTETGELAVVFLGEEYIKRSDGREDVSVRLFRNTWRQPSIIVRIEGEGPLADEVVIIGGHVDSTSNSGNAPGADDDGSGTTTVLEIFRALATGGFKPKRSIEFHGYAAEEVGLRGSQVIANQYANEGVNVYAMMQLDMTGYPGRPGTSPTIGIVTDFVNPQLTAFVRQLVTTYTDLGFTNTACGYACSDHASWTRAGYNASFPFETTFSNSNPNIHTNRDVMTHLSRDHLLQFAKLGLAYAVELSLAEV